MTSPEIDHVSFLVEHAQTVFAGEYRNLVPRVRALPLSSGTRVTRTPGTRLAIPRSWYVCLSAYIGVECFFFHILCDSI